MDIIKLNNLTKKFGDLTAVDNVSFSVKKGEIFGFLGPNGAGKTTTVSMLTTLKEKTSGEAFVNGYDISKDKGNVRQSIGIVFQEPSLDNELTVYENLKFHAMMYGMPGEKTEQRIKDMLGLVDLYDKRKVLAGKLSGGMKRRLEIARGFIHYPKVLFLDEPTVGLDPQTRHHIWEYIEKLNKKEKVTVILTTHYMEEAEKLAHRIAIMDHGKIIALETPTKLKNMTEGEKVSIETPDTEEVYKKLKKLDVKIEQYNEYLDLTTKNGDLSELLRAVINSGCKIRSISVHKPTLEDVYIHLTGKRLREEGISKKVKLR